MEVTEVPRRIEEWAHEASNAQERGELTGGAEGSAIVRPDSEISSISSVWDVGETEPGGATIRGDRASAHSHAERSVSGAGAVAQGADTCDGWRRSETRAPDDGVRPPAAGLAMLDPLQQQWWADRVAPARGETRQTRAGDDVRGLHAGQEASGGSSGESRGHLSGGATTGGVGTTLSFPFVPVSVSPAAPALAPSASAAPPASFSTHLPLSHTTTPAASVIHAVADRAQLDLSTSHVDPAASGSARELGPGPGQRSEGPGPTAVHRAYHAERQERRERAGR